MKESPKGQFRKVSTCIWSDDWFRSQTEPTRMLWLYLLTNQHTTSIPGLCVLGKGAALDDLGWSSEQLETCFSKIRADGKLVYEDRTRLLFLPNRVDHEPPWNPSHVQGWYYHLRNPAFPHPSDLKWQAMRHIRDRLELSAPKLAGEVERLFPEIKKAGPLPSWQPPETNKNAALAPAVARPRGLTLVSVKEQAERELTRGVVPPLVPPVVGGVHGPQLPEAEKQVVGVTRRGRNLSVISQAERELARGVVPPLVGGVVGGHTRDERRETLKEAFTAAVAEPRLFVDTAAAAGKITPGVSSLGDDDAKGLLAEALNALRENGRSYVAEQLESRTWAIRLSAQHVLELGVADQYAALGVQEFELVLLEALNSLRPEVSVRLLIAERPAEPRRKTEWDLRECLAWLARVGLTGNATEKNLAAFWQEARDVKPEDLQHAAKAYLRHPDFEALDDGWPLARFICKGVWKSRLPARQEIVQADLPR